MDINPLVEQVLKCFHNENKPIGLICVAPLLAAKLFYGVRITLGMNGNKRNNSQIILVDLILMDL